MPFPNRWTSIRHLFPVVAVVFAFAPKASAQYTVTYLNPASYSASQAMGASGGVQGGSATLGANSHAVIWTGSASSAVDLNPSGFSASYINALFGAHPSSTTEGGYGVKGVNDHALLWSGTAASSQDLNPSGYANSQINGLSASNQVGYGNKAFGQNHALLWKGSAASVVDLHPSGFSASAAFGTDGANQIGYGDRLGFNHALLWSGTADSAVDLNPNGYTETYGSGVDGNTEVGTGYGAATGNHTTAILWHGSASSVVDLQPAAFKSSQAWAVSGNEEVGWAWSSPANNDMHAYLWHGTAASAINLQSFLSSDYTTSLAFGIDASNGDIVGMAYNNRLGREEAVIWAPVPEPNGLTVGLIGLLAGGVALRLASRRN
jgi:hypothetical protein